MTTADAKVSVCMATYNGSRYVAEQLQSILAQLREHDEVVVVDDDSRDDTVDIVTGLGDARIVVHRNPENLGYVRTFERAIGLAHGEIILLADQDDLWTDGRRDALAAAAAKRGIAASNLVVLGSDEPLRSPLTGRPWMLRSGTSTHRLRNELRMLAGDAPYYGCAMAVHRDALPLVIPFPEYLNESHDLWIATVGNAAGLMTHIDAVTIRRRLHDGNASPSRPRGLAAVVRSRILLLRLWCESRARIRRGLRAPRHGRP